MRAFSTPTGRACWGCPGTLRGDGLEGSCKEAEGPRPQLGQWMGAPPAAVSPLAAEGRTRGFTVQLSYAEEKLAQGCVHSRLEGPPGRSNRASPTGVRAAARRGQLATEGAPPGSGGPGPKGCRKASRESSEMPVRCQSQSLTNSPSGAKRKKVHRRREHKPP